MSLLKFTHYQVRAHEKGVRLEKVRGMANTYMAVNSGGMRHYMFTDVEMVNFVTSL